MSLTDGQGLEKQARTERLRRRLHAGAAIPAHPLALTADRRLDEQHQRALTRYYLAAGAGGLAVGVHTTQFAIHSADVGLYRPVLELAAEEAGRYEQQNGTAPLLVAGLIGPTRQAVSEAELARSLGYDAGLLSLGAMRDASDEVLLDHCAAVAAVLPVFGFYLQPAVGGRPLSRQFWRRFCAIDDVVAIKVAPFNRYQTLAVVRGLVEAGRADDIALYTGNDDHIVGDLLEPYWLPADGGGVTVRFVGGLLGQWAVWTHAAVELHRRIRNLVAADAPAPPDLLRLDTALTDANAAIFDAAHGFAGCIPGIHEVLRRQGLLAGRWCLDPHEDLSAGQMAEIDRVCTGYPELADDAFVASHLDEWLR